MRNPRQDDWTRLDKQLWVYGPFLRDELTILTPDSERVASAIAEELGCLEVTGLRGLLGRDRVPVKARREELRAFQAWMDIVRSSQQHPAVIRAQVIVQNYLYFVYLGDALFKALRKGAPSGSVSRKCGKFLTDNPVRAFRNAVAHANWCYMPDFQGLEFWARRGNDPSEAITRFEVSQHELDFWQMLARAVAYTEIMECDH